MKASILKLLLLFTLAGGLGLLMPGPANAQTFASLYNFTAGSDGAFPYAGLLVSGNTLYGTTLYGGKGYGTVFAVNTNGTGFKTLYSFTNGVDGNRPYGGLILSGGTLYGTAQGGGSSQAGTVFAINTNGTGFTTLYSFTGGSDGAFPFAGLVLAGNTLYGTADEGGSAGVGTVFSLTTNGAGFATLHVFTNGLDGANPFGELILSGNMLYGTAKLGGSSSNGTVFALNINGTGFTTLHGFSGGDGYAPSAELTISGNILYGTTQGGGNFGQGTVFALNVNGTGFSTLYNFTAGSDGANPFGGLILAGNTLYGTARVGGSLGNGTVFALNPGGSSFSTIYSFANGSDGATPYGGLALAGSTLYGATDQGGVASVGTVYSVALGSIGSQLGALQVTISPSGVVMAGAQWQVDGGAYQNSGATVSNLSIGAHTLSFLPVTGWITPSPQTVTVSSGVTTPATGAYQPQSANTGTLVVTITPTNAIGAGAAWQVDGGPFLASGEVATNLSPGNNTISFKTITGWDTPSNQTVIITEGAEATASGFYKFKTNGSPVLTLVAPIKSQRVSNGVYTITGTVRDKVVVASVFYQLNGEGWTPANSTNSWTNWFASVTLRPGSNSVSAYAVDISDKFSTTNTSAFTFIESATLTVMTNGFGGITPIDNGKLLGIGSNYTLTATPGRNWIFSNWVASGGENFVTNSPILKFIMQSNLVLQANFVTNVFLAAQGTYHGLFAPTNAPRRQTNSGAFTFTVTSTGVLSGKLTIGTNTPSLSGQLNPAGEVTIITPRKGMSTLTNTLQLDFANQAVQGTVEDGSFFASLAGDQLVFNSIHRATNYEGAYTLIIPGTNDPTIGPPGTSYETVSVSTAGVITFSGSLADGTAITPMTSAISKDGFWPFYIPLYGGNGSLWGWNYFSDGAITSTNVSWICETNTLKTALYKAGFTNQAASIIGSAYNPAAKPLLALTNGEVILEGGDVPAIADTFILTAKNAIVLTNATDTNKLALTITPGTGVISGHFANPSNPKQIITVNGVLLQNQTNAQGYFLGTNQSGVFVLQSQ